MNLLSTKPFINRELSWLDFDFRVMALADDKKQPLLERTKFLAIAEKNFDEWYTVRIANLLHKLESKINKEDPAGYTAHKQIKSVVPKIKKYFNKQESIFYDSLLPELKRNGIEIVKTRDLSYKQDKYLEDYLLREIAPKLVIKNLNDANQWNDLKTGSLAFLVVNPETNNSLCVYLSEATDGIIAVNFEDRVSFVTLEDAIINKINILIKQHYPNQQFKCYSFKILRDMQITPLDKQIDVENIANEIEKKIQHRKLASIIGILTNADMPKKYRHLLKRGFIYNTFEDLAIYKHICNLTTNGLVSYSFLFDFNKVLTESNIEINNFIYPVHRAYVEQALMGNQIFENLDKKDYLIHHPYDSYEPVLNFFAEASEDIEVQKIYISIYRLSKNSPIVESLKKAAQNGKKVYVLMEIKARFDEEHNLKVVKELKESGVHVYTSFAQQKVHAKMACVVRNNKKYVHLSTGNYNEKSAKFYTDFSFFSANDKIGDDVLDIFHYVMSQKNMPQKLHELKMAPNMLRQHIIANIKECITSVKHGKEAEIWIKVNSLSDKKVINELYKASKEGVKVKLLVRGIATIVTGIPGISKNIELHSVVGRLLEHSRIYLFKIDNEYDVYLSSADVMSRNYDKRVELLFPIKELDLKKRVYDVFDVLWHDTSQTWIRTDNNSYLKVKNTNDKIPVQERFLVQRENQELLKDKSKWEASDE